MRNVFRRKIQAQQRTKTEVGSGKTGITFAQITEEFLMNQVEIVLEYIPKFLCLDVFVDELQQRFEVLASILDRKSVV